MRGFWVFCVSLWFAGAVVCAPRAALLSVSACGAVQDLFEARGEAFVVFFRPFRRAFGAASDAAVFRFYFALFESRGDGFFAVLEAARIERRRFFAEDGCGEADVLRDDGVARARQVDYFYVGLLWIAANCHVLWRVYDVVEARDCDEPSAVPLREPRRRRERAARASVGVYDYFQF